MDFNLKGKKALVTGGSRGIGRAVALMLAERGADVVICGRTEESLSQTAADLRVHGTQISTVQADVSNPADIDRLVPAAAEAHGGIDILVNNAVTSTSARFDQLTDEQFRYHIDVKLMAYIRIARLVLPLMQERGGGRIVNVGGMSARHVTPLRMTNGVVNAGVANFTKQFAMYAGPMGVTVNCVHPGYTATERVMQIFEREAIETDTDVDAIVAKHAEGTPLRALIQPEDIAGAVSFFCSPMARMITGQCLAVDGGISDAIIY